MHPESEIVQARAILIHPKGSMCMACSKRLDNCSHLDFYKMPILYRGESLIIVKCTEFKRNA